MVVVQLAPPALSGELALFHTTDPLLSNSPILIFYGPAATIASTSSRIQVHVLTPAGLGSYARLAVSPNSPFYSAVSNLPREEQGDETCRGLAFGLKKYFAELSENVKKRWTAQACPLRKTPSVMTLFGDDHVAILASRMAKIENVSEVIEDVERAFGEQHLSFVDMDVVLPPGSIQDLRTPRDSLEFGDISEEKLLQERFGSYAQLVQLLGEPAFLPTSKLRRAPSKPIATGRGLSFLRHQKENVRKELCELLDTEESYVQKISELIMTVVEPLRSDAVLSTSTRRQVALLFPQSLSRILEVNSSFLEKFSKVFHATEDTAIGDIESMTDAEPSAQQAHQDSQNDTQGLGDLAKCFCDWFPQFAGCYSDYIKANSQSLLLLKGLLQSSERSVSERLRGVGEQQLTSALIEPIQRLPRYTLYIDSISKQLPVRHPALKLLLKARDIISDICTPNDIAGEAAKVQQMLRSRTVDWPSELNISGRLVTIVDLTELVPPYEVHRNKIYSCLLLLFTGTIIILHREDQTAPTARALLAEIEGGQSGVQPPLSPASRLRFGSNHDISEVCFTERLNGSSVQMRTQPAKDNTAETTPLVAEDFDASKVFHLEGPYDGKAARLIEEVVKARVENRFSESERESTTWEPRLIQPDSDRLGLFCALFDNSKTDFVQRRGKPAAFRLVVEPQRHSECAKAGQHEITTVFSIQTVGNDIWRLDIDSLYSAASREHGTIASLIGVIRRRLAALAGVHCSIENPLMTTSVLKQSEEIIESIELQYRPSSRDAITEAPMREYVHRPRSPVKLLSNFLASTGPGGQLLQLKNELPPLPAMGHVPRISPPTQPASKPPSRESRPSSKDQATPKSISSTRSAEQFGGPTKKLEDTLSTYILALQARKGNIVGRSLKARISADELAVKELYNSLLEDPNMMVLAAQATVDVLFASFEKFLHVAWREQVGPVLPFATVQAIQSKAETLFPADFNAYFHATLGDLAPQNQRALRGVIKLLAELLDGTGNDGDRGLLTAAFAEVLVSEGDPHYYIALFDRFVDDFDTYFGETASDGHVKSENGSTNSHKRTQSVNSSSLTSNTSSFRKKFGFGTLSRENSKSEQDSKVASVWRTLSKSGRGDQSSASSISKGTLHRARSTDIDARGLPRRPSSQDGPILIKLSTLGLDYIDDTVPQTSQLGTIGEHPSFLPKGPSRKKRRSSLSDLRELQASQKSPPWSPHAERRPVALDRTAQNKALPTSPATLAPTKPSSVKAQASRFGSPARDSPRSRLPSSFMNENSPVANRIHNSIEQRPKTGGRRADEVTIAARPTSNIPKLAPTLNRADRAPSSTPVRTGLYERKSSGNVIKRPSPQPEKTSKPVATIPAQPKRLKVHSPQKLRERLQNEQAAVAAVHSSLQDELAKIGDELTATPSKVGSVRTNRTSTLRSAGQPTAMDLAARVLKMEGQLPKMFDQLTTQNKVVQEDIASSLTVSESKSRKLDELYREANAENEALYARFNDELGKVLRAVKGGDGVEELKKKLKESQDDAARLRKEASRLKRENLGLRAQLRE